MAEGLSKPRVAVIGAGYAGMAAAVELARADIDVAVFESSRTLGGRARVVEKDGHRFDNGQHILLGAYTETLRLLRFLGVSPKRLHAMPFLIEAPGRLRLAAAKLPAPLHLAWGLLTAKGMSWADRAAMVRLLSVLRRQRYALREDYSVSQLLTETRQTPLVRELIWDPLCFAALNTSPDKASAQVFANVLRDSVDASAAASEMLIPRVDLSELLPVPATMYLSSRHCPVHTANPIERIEQEAGTFRLHGDPDDRSRFSHVIVAVAPYHANALLEEFRELTLLRASIAQLAYEPITTIYLAYHDKVVLPAPMIEASGSPVQWLFDRGQFGGAAGLIAGVISASGPHSALSREELALEMHNAVERVVPRLAAPIWSQIITEKRATFACTPSLMRPLTLTAVKNLLLAGDYIDSPYPATLESAVRSGLAAARHVIRSTPRRPD